MALIVQKYGGTSVGSIERIKAVARRIVRTADAGNRMVVVVSAMAGETNRLFALANQLAEVPDSREADTLVATGEQASAALMAVCLKGMGYSAISLLAHQLPIRTDSNHGRARILRIDSDRVLRALDQGHIVVVAGYQGMDAAGDVTTLGRGASDLTAVALAAALRADACEIYTDVNGVYTADPNICPGAHQLARISYDEMLELAGLGAKVLQLRSVEMARRFNVPLIVRSSFSEASGTWVGKEDRSMEDVLVAGVSLDRDQSKITVAGVEDRPGLAARIFGPIAAAGIVVDMIIQNAGAEGRTDLTFTVGHADAGRALELVNGIAREIGASGVRHDDGLAKVSIVGLGMRSHAGVAARMFDLLAAERINIEMIATSEIKLSVVINGKYGELAVRVLHDALVGQSQDSQLKAS